MYAGKIIGSKYARLQRSKLTCILDVFIFLILFQTFMSPDLGKEFVIRVKSPAPESYRDRHFLNKV